MKKIVMVFASLLFTTIVFAAIYSNISNDTKMTVLVRYPIQNQWSLNNLDYTEDTLYFELNNQTNITLYQTLYSFLRLRIFPNNMNDKLDISCAEIDSVYYSLYTEADGWSLPTTMGCTPDTNGNALLSFIEPHPYIMEKGATRILRFDIRLTGEMTGTKSITPGIGEMVKI